MFQATSVVWALGRLSQKDKRQKEPSFHHTYTRRHTTIDFNRKDTKNECLPFVQRKPGELTALFLRGSVVPFHAGFCYRQVAILLCLLGTTIVISPPYH
jgi:hypothetical protein